MNNSPMSFNWSEAQKAWAYYKDEASRPASAQETLTHDSFSAAVEKAGPSVVSVSAIRKSRVRPATDGRKGDMLVDTPIGVGSGVIVDKDGYIVTNYHVIKGSTTVAVQFSNGIRKKAQIVGVDQTNDIAVLRVNIKTPYIAELGNSDEVKVGDDLLAIGTPFGLFSNSVTKGIVSSINHGPLYPRIQTDAAINYGNSGGALLNSKGQVVGISRSKFSVDQGDEIGINFGIPINVVKESFDQIKLHGRVIRNWFGAELLQLSREGYEQLNPPVDFGKGLLINRMEQGSPSTEAGLKSGDYMIEFDGHEVSDMEHLRKIFIELPIGKEVGVRVLRNNEIIETTIKLRERPQH
ncbi:MAG: trypsin-like peptidase domain-containing protein [Kangiellaceae bacterium]|nr:trypsin-like peptidase domain-containing protein [Kangiellaceae bacterium]